MSRHKRTILLTVSILVLLVGLGLVLYSPFADWYYRYTEEKMQAQFDSQMEQLENATVQAAMESAHIYNEKLFRNEIKITDPPERTGYFDQLNLTGNGMMGTIRIPSLDISLPVFHTVNEDVLTKGVGHMSQTSLPVGGVNTHSALSAHCGLASASMFTELERLNVGNFFYIDILGQTLVYQVTSTIVEYPINLEHLKIHEGKDLVTLITCTPYGINSHRLLVTGERVDENDAAISKQMASEGKVKTLSVRTRFFIIGLGIGTVLALMLVYSIVTFYKIYEKKKQRTEKEKKEIENEKTGIPDGSD